VGVLRPERCAILTIGSKRGELGWLYYRRSFSVDEEGDRRHRALGTWTNGLTDTTPQQMISCIAMARNKFR
jgi:hypothetical protein